MLFGPDKFEFKCMNKCLIIPKRCRPKITYDHDLWEGQYQATSDMECEQSSAKCSLIDRFEKIDQQLPVQQTFRYEVELPI